MDHIKRYNANPNVKMIVVLGEVGGVEEYDIVSAIKSGEIRKSVRLPLQPVRPQYPTLLQIAFLNVHFLYTALPVSLHIISVNPTSKCPYLLFTTCR